MATSAGMATSGNKPKVRIGVIGAGVIGRVHVAHIRKSGCATLAAIVEPSDTGKAFASELGVPWFADHAAMLGADLCDAVVIAAPNALHLPMALDCIAAELPALVEKPVTSTLADAQALTAASGKSGIRVLVGHHRRHNPVIAAARAFVQAGKLGRLTTGTVMYTFMKPKAYFDMDWRRRPETGGGPVMINLIHEIDLIRHICGEIGSVQAFTSNAVRGFPVEDTAAAVLRLVNGALITLSLSDTVAAPWSWDLAARENPVQFPAQPRAVQTHYLSGTEGSLTLPDCVHWSYKGVQPGWSSTMTAEVFKAGADNAYDVQLAHFCAVARGDAEPLCSAADATRTLAATLAVRQSAATGRAVELIA